MIKRVYGKSNKIDVVFERNHEDKWEAIIPRDASGVYYLQLYAEDDAGNITYFSTVCMRFDPSSFCAKFEVIDFVGNSEMKEFVESFNCEVENIYDRTQVNEYNEEFQIDNPYETKFKGGDSKCCY